MKDDYKDTLKQYRVSNGLSQMAMAEKLGLRNQQAYQYFEKKGVSLAKAISFGKKLGVDLTGEQKKIENVDEIKATLQVLMYRVAKIDSERTGRELNDCLKDLKGSIELVMSAP